MSKFSHIKTWIFDLDDTLYAPSTGFSAHMASVQKQSLSGLLKTDISGVTALLKSLVKKHGGAPFTGLHKEKSIDMDRFIEEGFQLDHSLLKACDLSQKILLNIQGRKVIFTSSPKNHVDKVLHRLEYQHIFSDENIFDVTRLDFETKPNQVPYDFVLNSLSEVAENCVMVEDNLKNLEIAKDMGMTTVAVHVDGEKPSYVDFSYITLIDFLEDVSADLNL
jgi:putative hydrolase of the HAD superfamily